MKTKELEYADELAAEIAGNKKHGSYTVRQALADFRGSDPDNYLGAPVTYDLVDGRTLAIANAPASDGGLLLGAYRYTTDYNAERQTWRALSI